MLDETTSGRGPLESENAPKAAWFDEYAAGYRYRYGLLMLGFPLLTLPLPCVIWRVFGFGTAFVVALCAFFVFVLVVMEWKTYYIRVSEGSINRGSILHNKTISLAGVDTIEFFHSSGGQRILYLRRGRSIALTAFAELDGFDDLLGFLRVYASHHHIRFSTRDDVGNRT